MNNCVKVLLEDIDIPLACGCTRLALDNFPVPALGEVWVIVQGLFCILAHIWLLTKARQVFWAGKADS